MPLLIFIYSMMEQLTCKNEPFWQEVSVESLILRWPLRPLGLLFKYIPKNMYMYMYAHACTSKYDTGSENHTKHSCWAIKITSSRSISYSFSSTYCHSIRWGYIGKTCTHNFHAITFTLENRMKIMRISCEKVIHVYSAKKIYNFHAKIMR